MTDWELLGQAWRATPENVDVTSLRDIVRSQRRKLMIVTAGEIAIVIAFAALSAFVVSDGIELWEAIWLITLWGFTTIACTFAIWNRRSTWTALGESVEEYVRITRLRAERRMRSVYFACGLFVAEAIAIVVQLLWFDRFTLLGALLLAASGSAIGVWCWVTRRDIARELGGLDDYGERPSNTLSHPPRDSSP